MLRHAFLSACLSLCFLCLLCPGGGDAATVTYDWNVTWATASPDGFQRPAIGINGRWPLPQLRATLGDRVVVNVRNQLGNRSTSLHFHGLFMNGSPQMDGSAGVTQCSIPIGGSFTYDFKVNQAGTYWYHAHNDAQYPDGIRGVVVIHDPHGPYADQYDEELVLSLSDWYHDFMPDLVASFISVLNPTGAEPVPRAALMNDTQNLSVHVQPGRTYMVRIVNMAAFAAQYLWFEGHTMRIVEVDGVYTRPAESDMLYISPAQRYSVLLTTRNDTSSNFAIVGAMDQGLFDTVPDGLNPNVTGWLVYDGTKALPDPAPVQEFRPFDDFALVPQDGMRLYDRVDRSIELNFRMGNLGDGANYAFFNDVSYHAPKVPTLYTALMSGPLASNVSIYGSNANAFVLAKDQVVEIVLNSEDTGRHPFHLHGHNFQVVARGGDDAGHYVHDGALPEVPMRRDTITVAPNSNVVLRFRADNPGVWLFHCHIEWHMRSGLVATMLEAPLELQGLVALPADHIAACRDQGKPYAGNAAGHTDNLLDLTDEDTPPAPLPGGFTARGDAAMALSCLSAFLGIAVISWYGIGEVSTKAPSS